MKISDIKELGDRIENGGWMDDIPGLPGLRLKVRGVGSTAYRRLEARLIETVPRAERTRGIDRDTAEGIASRCLHEVALVDWAGLTGEDGELLRYDPETARMLLTDPLYQNFRLGVIWAAERVGRLVGD
ncbi:hypothetical protein SAMN02799631_00382 [Methylobacterium sp. 174MFSha1.1]|uniref:hypothetical protein n=1 Tax=Methylobacterium sp. 174MFSha1.1 TaxID=1502749 RepID=UPI0008E1394E|nr:hypothetical protein [Methylobacterium sp. 174MFSha1.1]SFU38778.1 hypothetical protein SAMN02799631_00382 [Methylobacterium sp. 174MFSha1.1]